MSEKEILLKNFLKMMKNRKLEINKEILKENVNTLFQNNLNMLNKDIYFSFINEKVGVKDIKTRVIDNLKDKKYKSLVLITRYKFNSYIMNKLKELNKELEIFTFNNLYINLIDHILVPKHEVLPKKYEELIKEKFNNKLPLIKKTDPICKYYNCKVGQVLKIYRQQEIYYRMVN